jgi:hypothetical protein
MTSSDQTEYAKILDRLIARLEANPAVEIRGIKKTPPRQALPETLRDYPELQAFYRQVDEVAFQWRVKESQNPDHSGGLTIISSEGFDDGETPFVLDDGEFWMVNGEERTMRGKFFPIELIEDNAAVGVFAVKGIPRAEVFYFNYGINFYSLKTDWASYIQLLEMSHAVRYWQLAIVGWEHGESSSAVTAFGEILELISAGMYLQDFRAFYETKKLDF